jgi:hypothetical protein
MGEWLKDNWFKIVAFIAVNVFVFCMWMEFRDDIHKFFTKDNKVINQTTAGTPININAGGQQTAKVPDVYVNLQTLGTTQTTAQIAEKKNTKTDPDFVINQEKQKYTMSFNGNKPVTFIPEFEEAYKLEKGQFVYNSTAKMNINVEVPQPIWGIGIGKSFKGGVAIQGDARLGKTPFNVWGYASEKDQAIGLKFVQYGSKK